MSFTLRALVRHLRAWFLTHPPQSDAGPARPPAGGASPPLAPAVTHGRSPEPILLAHERAQERLSPAEIAGGQSPLPEPDVATRAGRNALKIVVVGDGNVGKTSLIRRYAKHKFSEVRNQTLGIDITTQEFTIGGRDLVLVLWDIEGQRGERPFFYYGANAALLVYDVTAPGSLEALTNWADRVRRYAPPDIPLLVAGNKVDLLGAVPAAHGRLLAEQVGARDHLRLSARTELNVADTFNQLAELASASLAAR